MTVFHFLTYNMCNVDDLESDEEENSDMENDDDIVEVKTDSEVDTDNLDFEDDIVDNEKSDEEKKSYMENDHNIE